MARHVRAKGLAVVISLPIAFVGCARCLGAAPPTTDAGLPQAQSRLAGDVLDSSTMQLRTAASSGAPDRGDAGQGPFFPSLPHAHIVPLPSVLVGYTMRAPYSDIAPGEAPSAAYPAGTVYSAQYEGSPHVTDWDLARPTQPELAAVNDSAHIAVTEWDLARGTRRRSVTLDLPKAMDLFIGRFGDSLRVVGQEFNGIVTTVRLTLDLQAGPVQALGNASAFGFLGFAGDASWSVVLFDGELNSRDRASGAVATTFDHDGTLLAQRILPPWVSRDIGGEQGPWIAKTAHGAFVAHRAFDKHQEAVRWLRLGRMLQIESDVTTPAPPRFNETEGIYIWHDRLFTWQRDHDSVWTTAEAFFDVPALREAGHCDMTRPIGDSDKDFWLGAEHVRLNGEFRHVIHPLFAGTDELWIEWTDPGADPRPPPPCPGAP